MKDIFEGLENLGLDDVKEEALFSQEQILDDDFLKRQREEAIRDILFDRKAECPVCQLEFTSRAVKSGKLRLDDSDDDLRPKYNKLDPIPYDVMVCPTCGYASLAKTFKYVKTHRIPEFKNKVSTKYTPKTYGDFYTYDEAIERFKLALYDGIIFEISVLEKAYICLKIAWLYRGKREEKEKELSEDATQELLDYEMTFLKQAYDGFKRAVDSEKFPQLGIDLLTAQYLVGELARRLGNVDEAFEIMAKLSISNLIGQRLKARVKKMKEIIVEERIRIKAMKDKE
jgi:hypothetical protein